MENYNAIGQWRDKEGFGYQGSVRPSDPDIDARGILPNGREFNGVNELQQLLLDDKERFLRCFVEKMLTYALGRSLHQADKPEVDRIVAAMPRHHHSIRGLIKSIVTSKLFLNR